MGRLVIYGAGGFGREVVTAARFWPGDLALMDDNPNAVAFAGLPLITLDDIRHDDQFVIAMDGGLRKRLALKVPKFATLIAPSAIIGKDVEIGAGSVFCDNTMVTARARIGLNFQCNIYSYVAHDCIIGDFVTFAPRVSCNGNVHVGDGAYIGTGAVIKHGLPDRPLVIGAGAVIGCGAVVTKDVAPGDTVVGNPARPMQARPALAA